MLGLILAALAAGLNSGTSPARAQEGLGGSSCTTVQPHQVDCKSVSAVTLTPVLSEPLPKGVYRVVSTGAWKNVSTTGASVFVDAECTETAQGFVRGDTDADGDQLDLKIDGAAQVWVPTTPTTLGCNPTEKKFESYVEVATAGRQLAFQIDDSDPVGNIGSLEVKIFKASSELGVDLQSVAGIVMIDSSNPAPVSVPAVKWSQAVVLVRGVYQWETGADHLADAECATTAETPWTPTVHLDDPNPLYDYKEGHDFLDVWVDGRDQHLVPVVPQTDPPPGQHCDEVGHAYRTNGGTMLVESTSVHFGVWDDSYWDNTGVLFGVVLTALPPKNPIAPATPVLTLAEAKTALQTVQGPVTVPITGASASSQPLAAGVYELTATGSWTSGPILADAECTNSDVRTAWDRDRGVVGNGDVRVNGQPTEWLPDSPDGTGCASASHVYHTYVTVPQGGIVTLDVDDPDDYPGNNNGATGVSTMQVSFRRVTHANVGGTVRAITSVAQPVAVYGRNEADTVVPLAGVGDNLILSSGTFTYRHFNEADAECSYAVPRNWVTDLQPLDLADLVLNGMEQTWGPTTVSGTAVKELECPMGRHERWTTVNSIVPSVNARVQDSYYSDNGGALVVTAFALGAAVG